MKKKLVPVIITLISILFLFPFISMGQFYSRIPLGYSSWLVRPLTSLPSLVFPFTMSPSTRATYQSGLYTPSSNYTIYNSLLRNYTSPYTYYSSSQYSPYYTPLQSYSPFYYPTSTIVPNVVGLTQAEAESIITSANLMPGITQEYSESIQEGHVVSQNPAANTGASYNAPVVLVISRGPQPAVALELVAEGFTAPIALISPEDGSERMFIADRIGLVKILSADGSIEPEAFLDIRNELVPLQESYDERGLLGLAFHPDFKTNGRFFVYYSAPLRDSAPDDWDHTGHLSEFTVSRQNPNKANAYSERILLQIDEPQFNNNAGKIVFGPDGYLYIALGDGGGANDKGLGHSPQGNAQDTSNLLGSILRIDVDNGYPYGIPSDNPFVGIEGRDEIFAFGFGNPFGISFDREGDNYLYVADVGQNLWEEVNIVTIGDNYGWNMKEASHCFDPNTPNSSPYLCASVDENGNPLIDPIIEYKNSKMPQGLGRAVIGGFVYRGNLLPDFYGKYIFGDWSTSFENGNGSLFIAMPSLETLRIATSKNGRLGRFLLSFGQDDNGELYVLTAESLSSREQTGKIYRILSASGAVPFITVYDQTLYSANEVSVAAVAYNKPGWLVIREDNGYGSLGSIIGQAAIAQGTNLDITITLNRDIEEEEILYATLHMDANRVGDFDFPGQDIPVHNESGQLILQTFLVNSLSQQMVMVPNIVGMNQMQAKTELALDTFTIGTITKMYSATIPADNVISQNPSAGTLASKGSSVSLVVSTGSQPRSYVP